MAQAASYGQIMDADYARETARSTGLMLRMQAGIGIHGQAGNLNSALVRGLLGG
jgi:flagellin-like hook-associated protein FlgL